MEADTRLDRWLWAARFYKTRRLAIDAISTGKVQVNHNRAKPARSLSINDEVTLVRGGIEMTVIILGLSVQRGPASIAQQLYRETEDSIQKRLAQIEQQRLIRLAAPRPDKKPDKKGRRDMAKFRGR